MNALKVFIAFTTICTVPACFAVPISSQPAWSSGLLWNPSCWSPCASLALGGNGLLGSAAWSPLGLSSMSPLLLPQTTLVPSTVYAGTVVSQNPSPVLPQIVTEKIISTPSQNVVKTSLPIVTKNSMLINPC